MAVLEAFKSVPEEPIHPWQIITAPIGYNHAARRTQLSGYYAAVEAMDANIGRILEWLDRQGLREDTIVFFTSDNGMNMGHHGIYGKGNGTFPQNMFDTAVKVPAIISQPGRVPAGRVSRALVSHYDYMPTLIELVDDRLKYPNRATLPGRSVASIIAGNEESVRDHIVVYNEYGPVRMIRDASWKYVHRYPYGPHELYNLDDDPDERFDLYGIPSFREKWVELRGALESWFSTFVDPEVDGTKEAVTGRGQNGPAGPNKKGVETFSSDYTFFYQDKPSSTEFDI
ncbi:MAG: sulfatase-like hydrolase/transferase [Spirochaetes bacterium]|nr:sulfatase-like hydrolase/transferase [Spirochaetota bacterium]